MIATARQLGSDNTAGSSTRSPESETRARQLGPDTETTTTTSCNLPQSEIEIIIEEDPAPPAARRMKTEPTHTSAPHAIPPMRAASEPERAHRRQLPLNVAEASQLLLARSLHREKAELPGNLLRSLLGSSSAEKLSEALEARRVGSCQLDFHCQICQYNIALHHGEETLKLPCGHRFCAECIRDYVRHKIEEGDVIGLRCPYINEEMMDATGGWACAHCTFFNQVARSQ